LKEVWNSSESPSASVLDLLEGHVKETSTKYDQDQKSLRDKGKGSGDPANVSQPGKRRPKKARALSVNNAGKEEKKTEHVENKTTFSEKRTKSFNKPLLRDRRKTDFGTVLWIRIRIRIRRILNFFGLPDLQPDPLVTSTDLHPDPVDRGTDPRIRIRIRIRTRMARIHNTAYE
jgi:hypothetical protein